jgi:hypothetical protein
MSQNCGHQLAYCLSSSSSYLALQPFVSLGLLDNSLPTISVLCLLPPSCHFMPCCPYLDPSDVSEAIIQGFLTVCFFYRNEVVSLMSQPPTWRTRVSLLVWPIAFDPSGMGGPTSNICYRRHDSQAHLGTQAPPLRESRDTSGGPIVYPLGDMWAWRPMVMMMPTGDNSWLVHQSSLAVLPAETSGASRGNGRRSENFAYQYMKCIKGSSTCRKILRRGTSGFTSHPKEDVLRIFIALKNTLRRRVWTRDPCIQLQVH